MENSEPILYNSEKPIKEMEKSSIKQMILKILMSAALIFYPLFSMAFMEEGDGLTACGLIFYVPIFCTIAIYYLYLIWGKKKISGAKILLLPLLQKINVFKTYKDNIDDRTVLAKAVLPFIISMMTCPMFTSILYENYNHHYRHNEWLMIVLLLPLVLLIFCFSKIFLYTWISQTENNE